MIIYKKYFVTLNIYMKNKKSILANQANVGLILDRFNKFIQRSNNIAVKSPWGVPTKDENWDGKPSNHNFNDRPKAGKHWGFGENGCLIGIQPQSVYDFKQIHFSGTEQYFPEHYPNGIDLEKNPVNSYIVSEGDRIFFKSEGIIVIPKNTSILMGEKHPWMLTSY